MGRRSSTAIRKLTDEECALVAILTDPTGVDLAEFTFTDREHPDNCFRLWDYQWPWFQCRDFRQANQGARSTGKTQGILMRCCAFPFAYAGSELLITAPQLNHLSPITDKIEFMFKNGSRLLGMLLPKNAHKGIKRQPQFTVNFVNKTTIVSRIPHDTGKGVKGMHPVRIEMDEAQDYPEAGFVEIIETMKTAARGSGWIMSGVPTGRMGTFRTYTTNKTSGWTVHRPLAMNRPSWNDEERHTKIMSYSGTEEDPDYRRNIYGEHGSSTSNIFVLSRLVEAFSGNPSELSAIANQEYFRESITSEVLKARNGDIASFLSDMPMSHLGSRYTKIWGGADIGFMNDPTEILIFGEVERKGKEPLVQQIARISALRLTAGEQAELVTLIVEHYGAKMQRFTLDSTGVGLPLYQALQEQNPPWIGKKIHGYKFSQNVAVALDTTVEEVQLDEDVIKKNVKDWSTDEIRVMIDDGHLRFPYDEDQLGHFQRQSMQITANGRRSYGGGSAHTLDACRMAIAGRNLLVLEKLLEERAAVKKFEPVTYMFGYGD